MSKIKKEDSKKNIKKDDQIIKNNKTDDKAVLVTRHGLKQLKDELEHLVKVKRKEIAERIKEAISYGDLSENSEYEDAKNEQAFIEGRILELERMIKEAKIIEVDSKKKADKVVQMGTTVVLKNLSKKTDECEEYTIVGSTESDPINNKISNESPLGKALLDKEKGEKVEFVAPAGIMRFEIVKLK